MLPEILLTFLLLIISSYFVLLKILKNYVAEKKQRNITSLGIAVFISPILFIIISFIYLFLEAMEILRKNSEKPMNERNFKIKI